MEILKTLLYMLFALNALFLVGIELMQEGKGGGLGNAFGGAVARRSATEWAASTASPPTSLAASWSSPSPWL